MIKMISMIKMMTMLFDNFLLYLIIANINLNIVFLKFNNMTEKPDK